VLVDEHDEPGDGSHGRQSRSALTRLRRGGLVWGIADQSISSATNLALAVLAGRRLGPADLGLIAVGFASYVMALVLLRATVTEPTVVTSARPEHRPPSSRAGLTLTLGAGIAIALVLAGVGWSMHGTVAGGLLLFAPWIAPALLQDFWRFTLFGQARRSHAAANDLVWLVVMAAAVPIAWRWNEPWAIVGCWGLGATVAGVVGFAQLRFGPVSFGSSLTWWRTEAASLGGWLAVEAGFLALGSQGALLLLASVIGAADLGGLRAVQSVFVPLTLIGPAITLPGLPALASALETSTEVARVLATRLTIVALVLAGAYVGVFLLAPGSLLGTVYGPAFVPFAVLAVPVAVAQMAHAAATGDILLLKAGRRGRALALARGTGTLAALLLAWTLATDHGVRGAAWGLALGVAVSTSLIVLGARRSSALGPNRGGDAATLRRFESEGRRERSGIDRGDRPAAIGSPEASDQ
jgi:O-antigen/teichoic acid export membrane protein